LKRCGVFHTEHAASLKREGLCLSTYGSDADRRRGHRFSGHASSRPPSFLAGRGDLVCLQAPVYIDLSGWSPKYFSATLVQYSNSLLKHKVLFGSDYPLLTPERWMADFEKIGIKDEVRPLILKDNAIRLFGFGAA
jgi:predicted TIM-barrel fold metal-dependent hydrolase